MTDTRLDIEKEFEVENPVFIEGLAGIGHIGKTTVSYLVDHLGAEKIGELTSHHYPPYTIVREDKTVDLLKNNIYQLPREDGEDLVFIEGNAQSSTPQGHYEIAEKIVELVERIEASRIVTVGGYGTGDVVEDPQVFGATTSEEARRGAEEAGVDFDHDVGQIVGASGLILGLAREKGYEGICLLGETPGFLLSDPKATEAVLKSMEGIVGVDLDLSELDDKIDEAQEVLKKLQNLQQQQVDQDSGNSDLGYIG
ncbi:MAG: proteasome assembly chaperone family protein [Candidatus Nanohaloarchaea archaeon]